MNEEYNQALEQLDREAAALDFSKLHEQIDAQAERIQHLKEQVTELFEELIKKAGD